MDNLERSRIQRAADRAKLAEDRAAEIAAYDERKGELPTMELTAIEAIKAKIEQARSDRQAAKATLVASRDTEQARKAELQIQLDATIGKTAKDAVRVQLDACNATLEQAQASLAEADATLESLRIDREEILFRERLAKKALNAEDEPRVRAEKKRDADDIAEKRAWLVKAERR